MAEVRSVPSPWAFIDRQTRLAVLTSAYDVLWTFHASNQSRPTALFGVVLDRRFHPDWSIFERERFAYEVLLNKFDTMLRRIRARSDSDYDPNRRGADYLEQLWNSFDAESGSLHGCVHYTPLFPNDGCACRPCNARRVAPATL